MLIPGLDLQNGRIVRPAQPELPDNDDMDAWIARLKRFPRVHLNDINAAMSRGNNDTLVQRMAAQLACSVGGGVGSVRRGEELLEAGARAVIAGSALFRGPGQWAAADAAADPTLVVNHDFARALAQTLGPERLVFAVDVRNGRVVIHGGRTALPISALAAVLQLERYCDELLLTQADKAQGLDVEAIRELRKATSRRVTAGGAIATHQEIDALQAVNVDAVVSLPALAGLVASSE
jgi:phosphoribosylformimino-5-aminoimidazole carboxamide ribonucleotide (ProFAR) isomerase